MIFLDIFLFLSGKNAFCVIFSVFHFVLNFCDFSVFFLSQKNLPL